MYPISKINHIPYLYVYIESYPFKTHTNTGRFGISEYPQRNCLRATLLGPRLSNCLIRVDGTAITVKLMKRAYCIRENNTFLNSGIEQNYSRTMNE